MPENEPYTIERGGKTFESDTPFTDSKIQKIDAWLQEQGSAQQTAAREQEYARSVEPELNWVEKKTDFLSQGLIDLSAFALGAGFDATDRVLRFLGYPEEVFSGGYVDRYASNIRGVFGVTENPPETAGDKVAYAVGGAAVPGAALRAPGYFLKLVKNLQGPGATALRALNYSKAGRAGGRLRRATEDTLENITDVTAAKPVREIGTELTGEAGAALTASLFDNPLASTVAGFPGGMVGSVAPAAVRNAGIIPTVKAGKDFYSGIKNPGIANPTVGQRVSGGLSKALEDSMFAKFPGLFTMNSRNQLQGELAGNLSPEAQLAVRYAAENDIGLMDTGDPELHALLNYVRNTPSFQGKGFNGPAVVSQQLESSVKRLRESLQAIGEGTTIQDVLLGRINADKAELKTAAAAALNDVLVQINALRNNPDGSPTLEQLDISQAYTENIQKAYDAATTQEKALYNAIPNNALIEVGPLLKVLQDARKNADPNEETMLPAAAAPVERALQPILRRLENQKTALEMKKNGATDAEIAQTLSTEENPVSDRTVRRLLTEEVKTVVPYSRLKSLNMVLGDVASSATRGEVPAGSQNRIRNYATDFRKGFNDSLDLTVENGANGAAMPEEAVLALRRARAYTQEKYETFINNSTVRRLVQRNSFDQAQTEATAGLDSVLSGTRAQREAKARALVDAARFHSTEESLDDRTVDFIKDYLRGDFVRAAAKNEPGMPIDPKAAQRWIDANYDTLERNFPDVKIQVEEATAAADLLNGKRLNQADMDKALSNWSDPEGYGVLAAIVGEAPHKLGQTIFKDSKPGVPPSARMEQVLTTMHKVGASPDAYNSLKFSLREFLAMEAGLLSPETAAYSPIESLDAVSVGRALDYVRRPTKEKPNPNYEVLSRVFSEDELADMELSFINLRNLAAFQNKNTGEFIDFLGEDQPSQLASRLARVGALRGVGSVANFGTIQTPQILSNSVGNISDTLTTGVKRKYLVQMIADPKRMQEALEKGGRNTAAYRFPFSNIPEPKTNGIWTTKAENDFRIFKKAVEEGGQLVFPDRRGAAGNTLLRSWLVTEAQKLAEAGEEGQPPTQAPNIDRERFGELYGYSPGQRTTR